MASQTEKELDLAGLRKLLQLVLQLPDGSVRFANEAAPAGNSAYVTIEHHTDRHWGKPKRTWKESTETSTIKSNNQGRLTVNAYGTGSFRLLNKLRALLLADPAVKSSFRKLGIGLLHASTVRDISALAGSAYEHRAVVDFELTYTHVITTSTKRVDVTEVHVQPDPGAGPVIVKIERP